MRISIKYMSISLIFTSLLYINVSIALDKWTIKDEVMPNPRWGLSSAVVNGKIYIIGGSQADNKPLSLLEEYDPISDKWTKKSKMPVAVCYSSASAVKGKIYVIGGMSVGWSYMMNVLEYDPKTDVWNIKSNTSMPIVIPCACVLNDKIYITGFSNAKTVTMEYDPVKDRWRDISNMAVSRQSPGFSAVNGKIYAIGGMTNFNFYVATVEEYDPEKDEWKKKSDMPTERMAATCAIKGRIYAIGGWDGESVSTVEEYNPKTDTWAKKTSSIIPRCTHTLNVVNGKIYVIGGLRAFPTPEPIIEEYTPEDWQFSVSSQEKTTTTWGYIKQ